MSTTISSAISGNGVSGTGSYDFDAVKLTNKMTESVEKSKISASDWNTEMTLDVEFAKKTLGATLDRNPMIKTTGNLNEQAEKDGRDVPKISKPPATGAFGITA